MIANDVTTYRIVLKNERCSFVSEAIKGTNRLVQKSCKRAMNNTFLDHPESLFGISTSLRRMYKKAQFC